MWRLAFPQSFHTYTRTLTPPFTFPFGWHVDPCAPRTRGPLRLERGPSRLAACLWTLPPRADCGPLRPAYTWTLPPWNVDPHALPRACGPFPHPPPPSTTAIPSPGSSSLDYRRSNTNRVTFHVATNCKGSIRTSNGWDQDTCSPGRTSGRSRASYAPAQHTPSAARWLSPLQEISPS